jgi:putative PIN family toxin of toxin-antitoxin system
VIVAVLDTNVLASGFIGEDKPDSTPGELVRRWRFKAFALVVSEHILAELADTFTDPYFARRLSPEAIAAAFDSLRLDAVIQSITVAVDGVASHADDDAVLATALSAGAPYVVTGDQPLLARVSYGGTQLLSPRAFLAVLENEAPLTDFAARPRR